MTLMVLDAGVGLLHVETQEEFEGKNLDELRA